ncbi:MAG TPA: hypothetical protein VFB72_18285 [Verrucomicrobiae bacterium]|nr:hypothetical protein [Verrucomicrobiae bacterium]
MESDNEKQIGKLFATELQFRLASAVRLAVTLGNQPLDLPTQWTHGRHSVGYEEIALRQDQADFAACFLHRSATYLMAVAIKDAIRATVHDPKTSTDSNIRNAYQVARLIRNAFAHDPTSPAWSIDADCQNKIFSVPNIISLDTTKIHGTDFDWRHYGGPLALFRLCRFVRIEILKDKLSPRKDVPVTNRILYQQGNLILQKVDAIPLGVKRVEPLPDGCIPLGDGHFCARLDR